MDRTSGNAGTTEEIKQMQYTGDYFSVVMWKNLPKQEIKSLYIVTSLDPITEQQYMWVYKVYNDVFVKCKVCCNLISLVYCVPVCIALKIVQ